MKFCQRISHRDLSNDNVFGDVRHRNVCVRTISVHLARRATANGKPLKHNIYSKHRFPRKSTQSHVSFISRNEFKCVEKEFFRFYIIQQWRTHLLCDQIVEVWPPNSIQFDVPMCALQRFKNYRFIQSASAVDERSIQDTVSTVIPNIRLCWLRLSTHWNRN